MADPRGNAASGAREPIDVRRWRESGKPGTPPPSFKHELVLLYAREFGLKTLVETGTFRGDMLAACSDAFDWLYSIELDVGLFLRAQERFADCPQITLVPGDSAQVLGKVLRAVDQPCLIWLDGHAVEGVWDGERAVTPVVEELEQILASSLEEYVLLIDDARLFGRPGYPAPDQVEAMILERHPDWVVEVEDDVVRAHPRTVSGTG